MIRTISRKSWFGFLCTISIFPTEFLLSELPLFLLKGIDSRSEERKKQNWGASYPATNHIWGLLPMCSSSPTIQGTCARATSTHRTKKNQQPILLMSSYADRRSLPDASYSTPTRSSARLTPHVHIPLIQTRLDGALMLQLMRSECLRGAVSDVGHLSIY